MASRTARAHLADDLQSWVTQGLVPPSTATVLRERWNRPNLGIAALIKYLGVLGGGCALLGLLGLVASVSGSWGQAGMCLAIAVGFLWAGLQLWRDPRARHVGSARLLLGLGTAAFGGGVWLLLIAAEVTSLTAFDVAMWVTVGLAFFVAYRYGVRFVLFIGLASALSWIGASPSMHGRNSYSLVIAQTGLTLAAGAAVVAFGLWHERSLDERHPGFSLAYQVMGLVYGNFVLLVFEMQSLDHHALFRWLGIFLISIAELVLGARLLNALLTGFGVTLAVLMGIAIYAERYWERLDHGVFFLLGGAVLFALGLAFELRQREVSP